MLRSRPANAVLGAALAVVMSDGAAAQAVQYTFNGASAYHRFGTSVSGAGDVNNDGYDDLIVGAPCDNSGSAQVFSGLDGSSLHKFFGDSAQDQFGASVDGAGDLNHDGCDDLIVGAPYAASNGNGSGRVRIYSGQDGAILYTFDGFAGSHLGYAVSRAGDVNNDGTDDVIAGTYNFTSGGVRVFSGLDGTILYIRNSGLYGTDLFGNSVSGAGDVDNDGYDDFIVGIPRADDNGPDTGSAHVYSGFDGAILYAVHGSTRRGELGGAVSGAGDVNNDGYDDFVVGARRDNPNGWSSGSARVYSGQSGAILYTFNGELAYDYFGTSVSGAGDVNNDGYDDLIVGAPGSWFGDAYVYSGQDGSLLYSLSGMLWPFGFGSSVSGAGDVNNDGCDDLIVGSPGHDSNGIDSGSASVFLGTCGSVVFGYGCRGTGNIVPTLRVTGCPSPGSTVTIEIRDGLGGAWPFLFLGTQRASIPLAGNCRLNVYPPLVPPILLSPLSPSGALDVPVTFPASALLGTIMLQVFVQDAGVVQGYSNTNGVELTVQ